MYQPNQAMSGSQSVESCPKRPGLTTKTILNQLDFSMTKMEDCEPKVFLGGTCGASVWREEVVALLTSQNISFYNPQKAEGEWQIEDMGVEELEKKAGKSHIISLSN